jgi:3-oxoacyl-[acyl-carrier protein] reductase
MMESTASVEQNSGSYSDREPRTRHALVTAGSRGLGLAAAKALAMSGHDLVLCSRDSSNLERAGDELQLYGQRVMTVTADVSKSQELEIAIEAGVKAHGNFDVLVANAGGPRPGDFLDISEADWHRGFDLTVMSVVRTIRHVLPAMCASGFGRVIVIGSTSILSPIPSLTLSNALRPALAGLVTSLAQEVAHRGVTVNLIAPGRIDTDRLRELDKRRATAADKSYPEFREQAERKIPAGRYGRPDEIGGLVAFLASSAADYLTGQSIVFDGGLVPRNP